MCIRDRDLPGTVKQPDDDTDDEVAICEQENKCYNLAIQALQAYQKPTGETSDGYHTFNELYEHRTALFAALCNTYNDRSWKSFKHADGTMYDGMFIAGIETPEGQYTYHCEEEYLYMFAMTKEMPNAPEWDGHKPSDYSRLFALNLKEGYRPERELYKIAKHPNPDDPVSYTHLDVYKRQAQRRAVGRLNRVHERKRENGGEEGLLFRCLLYTSRCV